MRKIILFLLTALFSLTVAAQLLSGPSEGITSVQSTAEGTVTPTTINVTTVVGVPATRTIMITNTGTVTFTPLTAFFSDYGFFTVDSAALCQEIPPLPGNNVQFVTVTFTPLLAGTYNATLNVRIGDVIHYVHMHGTSILRGDADNSGSITIQDVTTIITALLEDQEYSFELDTNLDGKLSILDVTTLIEYLLSGTWPDAETPEEMLPGVVTVNDVSFKMMPVKGGSFTMGATDEQGNDYFSNEIPTHEVTVSSFYLCETEVTQALWRAVMGSNPSYFTGDIMRPVEKVSWSSCQSFITKLNQMTGYNFRLPTEAEWEYAARGGQVSNGYKYSGSNNYNDVGWNNYNSSSTTHPVATLAPNELGLYDMSGNVFEWCQDWYGEYTSDVQVNPTGPDDGTTRVCRGGAWIYNPTYMRTSYRYHNSPSTADIDLGFRIAIDSTFTPPVLPPFTLSCLEVTMEVEQVVKVGINNGSGNYSVSCTNASIVDCAVEGDSIVLTGLAEGTTKVTVTDMRNQDQISIPVTVTAKDNSVTFVVNGVSFKMVPVEGGKFQMGLTPEQQDDYQQADERPVHEVALSDFMIGQTEVTQALWLAVMGSNPSEITTTLKHPVERVSWLDCQEFISRLNELTGREFRLPSEAEWEYAARGGNRTEGYKYAGSNNVDQVAWYFMNAFVMGEQSPNYGHHEVGKKKANELGLYDMSGNVGEWCQDLYARYTTDPYNPGTPSNDSTRVYRGGYWAAHDHEARIANRESRVQTRYFDGLGLRLALTPPPDPARLALSEDTLSMDVGTTQRVKILNGSGQYTLSYDTALVECQVTDGDILVVTSKVEGEAIITITDDISHGQTTLTVNALEAMTIMVNGVSLRMIKVQGGSFMMGSQSNNANASEKPAHKVNLSTFYISETEVPQKLWKAVLGYTPQDYTSDELPYLQTSGANNTFIKKINQVTGLNFRLPTEAEWEFAARGGNKSEGYLYAGSDNLDEVAWTSENCDGTPQEVGTKKPNELGLYDMSGNVIEWCLDTYYDYDLIEQTNPLMIGTSISHIYRGGCVVDSIGCCRTTWRSESYPINNYTTAGLRLVLGDAIDLNALALSCSKKSITVGGETSVEITNGSGVYTMDYDSGIVTCQITDENLVVTGNALGTATIILTDQQTQQQCTLTVDVIAANTYTVNGVTFSMIPVDGGTFTMGATEEQDYYASNNERPAHEVTLSDYAIGQTEVTSALWNAVMDGTADPSKTYPKTKVTLEEIQSFIARLNALTGAKFRLPTEAEWEYAARGGSNSQGYLYCGSNNINDVAWFKYNSSNNNHPVAMKQPNELGLYDMSGNVMEMCMDYYEAYTSEPQTNPCNLIPSYEINSRGGNHGWKAINLRTSKRQTMIPSNAVTYEGFRLAMGNAQASPEITAVPNSLYINVGEQDHVTVKYGSGSYTISSDKDILTWEEDNDTIVFTATAPGHAIVTIEDAMVHEQTTVDIIIIQPTTYTVNGVSFDMVDVEGGTFYMGIPSTNYSTTYGHDVTLSDFSIGQTEVTRELWQAVMGGTETTNLQLPQASVSWNKCQEFIMKLNALTGENFRLPTESEWEFAAMGGNLSHGYTYSGSNNVDEVAWYKKNTSLTSVHAVAQKKPNELMLYDMSGNVREYCLDIYEYYPRTPQVNPTGATYGPNIIDRGGDYYNDASWCEVKRRHDVLPTQASNLRGLRLAKGDAIATPTITLRQNDLALGIGEQGTVQIAYGTESYHLEYDQSIVSCQVSGQEITVYGLKVGAADVIIYDDLANCQTTLHVLVKDTETITVNNVSFEMIILPGGTFLMGGTPEMNYNVTSYSDERPVHEVTLSPFSIGQTEVTQALWLAVMGSNPSEFNSDLQCPVDNVSWEDCQQFITQLNALTGRHFRLPTEAEWEYAARGGNCQRFRCAGSNTYNDVAWFSSNSNSTTHPVAQKQPNTIGTYDMTGNIAERCQDWKSSYSAEPQIDPTGPANGTRRVVRGASWNTSSPSDLKISARSSAVEGTYNYIGLRLVMVPN